MFIIFNNQKIYKFADPFTIGTRPDCKIQISDPVGGVYARIVFRDDDYFFENSNLATVIYNNSPIDPHAVLRIENEDVFMLKNLTFQCHFQTSDTGFIEQSFDNKILKIQADVHTHVLDFLKKRNDLISLDNTVLRRTLVEQIEIKLSGLVLEKELLAPFLRKALKKLLLSRVERKSDSQFTQNLDLTSLNGDSAVENRVVEAYLSQLEKTLQFENPIVEAYLSQLEKTLQLEDIRDETELYERINALLNWGIRRLRGLDQEAQMLIICEYFKTELLDIIFGLGPLQELMDSDDINDIMVLPSGHIFVDKGGRIEDSEKKMLTPEVSLRIIQKIISVAGRRIDQTNPMVDARVADGSRLNAIIQPLAVGGPALTIRKFADGVIPLFQMVRGIRNKPPSLTQNAANFLEASVLAKKNIVVAGGTGSGKTTLINALSSLIPEEERIVIIEDTTEIKLNHKHIVQLQSRPANLEGKNEITIRKLVKNALRMRPNRIIIGECRSGETLDMLQAMNTGHEGSLTTVHANSPADALRRIEVMSLEAEGIDLPSRAIREQITSAIDLIVQINRFSDGRKLTSVSQVVEYDEETNEIVVEEIFKLRNVYKKRAEGLLLPGRELAFTGYVPTFIEDLLQVGKYTIEEIL